MASPEHDSSLSESEEDNFPFMEENSPIHHAASKGHTKYLLALIDGGESVNSCNQYGNTLLHLCALNGHVESMLALFERDAIEDHRNKYGNTLLHCAALNGHKDCVVELINRGNFGIDCTNNAGSTPLHYAAMMGRVSVMSYLLEKGADPNKKNHTESTPLHAASLNGFGECMNILLHSPNTDASLSSVKNKYGYTPVDYADSTSRGHSPIFNNPDTMNEYE
eukprot:TRINITY_DN2345_c0_g1_i3.p1 TRINITY_DN2345_c0_g1~~TRINITY_DN2345_c0_g1_i3.p1  ORF type:complete len:244 (-),score=46.80 TRINITY_DN2345_c0_g1_i3:47-712(-)